MKKHLGNLLSKKQAFQIFQDILIYPEIRNTGLKFKMCVLIQFCYKFVAVYGPWYIIIYVYLKKWK